MKTLYESILDDEEVLIVDVKKATNPFVMIFNLLNSSKDIRDDFKIQMEIKKVFNKYLAEGLPYEATSNIRFRFAPQFFSIYISKLIYNDEDLITITQNNLEAAKELNTHKGDNIAILFLDDKAFRRQVKEYGFKSLSDYRDWKNYIAAKYKLNKSKDNYIYTI